MHMASTLTAPSIARAYWSDNWARHWMLHSTRTYAQHKRTTATDADTTTATTWKRSVLNTNVTVCSISYQADNTRHFPISDDVCLWLKKPSWSQGFWTTRKSLTSLGHCSGCSWTITKGVGAQSTFGGTTFLSEKYVWKNARILHDSCQKSYQNTTIFVWYFPRN